MHDSPEIGMTREGMLEFIERIRGGAKDRLRFDQIRLAVGILMKACQRVAGLYQTYRLATDLEIIRVRPLEQTGQWFDTKSALGPPPRDKILSYGRCHQPNRPVGYCSLYEETALAEMRAQSGVQYLISTFILPAGSVLLPVGEFDYFRRSGQTYLGESIQDSKRIYREVMNREDWSLFAIFDAFLADEFIKPAITQADYKVTSAMADILLNSDLSSQRIDALIYPSVAFRAGTNFAVRADSFRSLKVVEQNTYIIEITDLLGYGIYEWKNIAVLESVAEDDSLKWRPLF